MAPNSFSSSDRGGSSHEHEDGTQSCCGDLVCVYKIMCDKNLHFEAAGFLLHQMPSEKLVLLPTIITYTYTCIH